MSTLNIQVLCRSIDFPELAIFASRPGAMINLHWLELPIARTIFHGPKGVRAIEVRLYLYIPGKATLLKIACSVYGPIHLFFFIIVNPTECGFVGGGGGVGGGTLLEGTLA